MKADSGRSSRLLTLGFILHTCAHQSIVPMQNGRVLGRILLIRAGRKTLDDRVDIRTDEVGDRVPRPRETLVTCEPILAGWESDTMKV